MAIYGQPTAWTCGPFALKHALLAHSVFAREHDLAGIAGTTEATGTNERQLRRAAWAHGGDLLLRRETAPGAARRSLETWLGRAVPVLLCLDQWDHWVTAVAADAAEVVIFDSKYDAPLRAEGWDTLLGRLAFHRRRLRGLWSRTLYDLHPLVARRPGPLRLALTVERARHLLRPENAALARRWDDYARSLLGLMAPGVRPEPGHRLDGLIETRRTAILDLATALSPAVGRPAAALIVDGLGFAAGLYQAELRPEEEPHLVGRLGEIVVELVLSDSAAAAGSASAAA